MKKIAIIRSEYYHDIMDGLLADFYDYGKTHDLKYEFKEFFVVGTMEIPFAMKLIVEEGGYDGVAVFGCVIMGETYHNEIIQNSVHNQLASLSLEYRVPVGYSILTVKNREQALARSIGAKSRGHEALAALESIFNVKRDLCEELD